MKLMAIIAVQVLLAFVVAASAMPMLMATVPAVQNERVGVGVAVAVFVVSFGLIALVWPGRRPRPAAREEANRR